MASKRNPQTGRTDTGARAQRRAYEQKASSMARAIDKPGIGEITPASQWKSSKSHGVAQTTLKVPSGNTCLVRMISPEDFLSSGDIPDVLAPIVNDAIRESSGKPPSSVAKDVIDASSIAEMMAMVDGVILMAVIEPVVSKAPIEGERDEELLYVDQIDLEDKMFIMQFVLGGTRDLERFRSQQEAAMAGMDPL